MPKKSYDLEALTHTITYDDGSTATIALSELSDSMRDQLALHGLGQKRGDSYAGAAKASEEEGITVEDYCKVAVEKIDENLRAGNFNAGGGGGIRGGIFVEALSTALSKPQDEVLELVKSWDEDKIKQVKKHPQVKNAMLQIRAKRAEAAAEAAPALSL